MSNSRGKWMGWWIALSLLWGAMAAVAIPPRVANSTLRLPSEPPSEGYQLTNAFPGVVFDQPVAIAVPPGETNRLFVVERPGRIVVITNLAQPSREVFLELTNSTSTSWVEAGMLGLAFHPGYATNGSFFVFRTLRTTTEGATNLLHCQLSRFQVSSTNANAADPASEVVFLAQADDSDEHNGGDLQFGPDGYLYVALGDHGAPPTQASQNPQAIDAAFFSGILRLDVDRRPGNLPPNPHPAITTNYLVPVDNPFVGITNYQGLAVDPARLRTEFYAIGFRNPWRIHWDFPTGNFYAGEVGGGSREEVNLVMSGANYGWPYREGTFSGIHPSPPPGLVSQSPLYEYERDYGAYGGRSVSGGRVYRGDNVPGLVGAYVFGDYISGNIWALRHSGTNLTTVEWLTAEPGVSAFGADPANGDLLVADVHDGVIFRLRHHAPVGAPALPEMLSNLGAFTNLATLAPAPGVVPYRINVPFWSDNAIKTRWFSLPNTDLTIDFSAEGNWSFPTGTVWVKHFDLEMQTGVPTSAKRIETRFLVMGSNGVHGFTYRWNETGSDAVLVAPEGRFEEFAIAEGGILRTQLWHYPGRRSCLQCHTPAGGHALGFSTAQLNRDFDFGHGPTNQLLALAAAGYFGATNLPAPASLRVLAHGTNTSFPLEYRARSYLEANCAYCHNPSVYTSGTRWDGRIETPRSHNGIIDGTAIYSINGPDDRVIKPQSAAHSALLSRIDVSPIAGRMPPLGSTVYDTNAIHLIRQWITNLPVAPWRQTDIGTSPWEGSTAIDGGSFQVAASGAGVVGTNDALHFVHQPLKGNGHVIARLTGMSQGGAAPRAGLMFRDGHAADAAFGWVALSGDGTPWWSSRSATGAVASAVAGAPGLVNRWLRLNRQGADLTGYVSDDGTNWTRVGGALVGLPTNACVGLSTAAGGESRFNLAAFNSVSTLQVSLTQPASGQTVTVPGAIPLAASVARSGRAVARVEFYANGEILGTVTNAPWTMLWTNALAGAYDVAARVMDEAETPVWSESAAIVVEEPPGAGNFRRSNSSLGGQWPGVLGGQGQVIAGDSTNLPPAMDWLMTTGSDVVWEANSADLRAMRRAAGSGRVAAGWTSISNVVFQLSALDGLRREVSLYFLDWDLGGARTQRVELWDVDAHAIIESRDLAEFAGGVWMTWSVRGRVEFRIIAAPGSTAVLSGVLIDGNSNVPPSVVVNSPAAVAEFTGPVAIPVGVTATDGDGAVRRIEWLVDEQVVGTSTNVAPALLVVSNLPAGLHELRARAYDDLDDSGVSAPVTLSVKTPPSAARFVGLNSARRGDWRGEVGSEGYVIFGHATNGAAAAGFAAGGLGEELWLDGVTNTRALQHVEGPGRIEAFFTSAVTNSVFEFQFSDGLTREVALYFIDLDYIGRSQRIEVRDAVSGLLLDSRSVSGFGEGCWMTWRVRGPVRFVLDRLAVGTVLTSGVFWDVKQPLISRVELVDPQPGFTFSTATPLTLQVVTTSSVPITAVEYLANGACIGLVTNPATKVEWTPSLVGSYEIQARCLNSTGTVTVSSPVPVEFLLGEARALFLGEDNLTKGNWLAAYGTNGVMMAGAPWTVPGYVSSFAFSNAASWVWTSTTLDERALVTPDQSGRIAGTIHAWGPELSFDLTLADGKPHLLALYFLDWDELGREMSLELRDAVSGALLDQRSVSAFGNGRYLVWEVAGPLRVTARSPNSIGPVIGGVFLSTPDRAETPLLTPGTSLFETSLAVSLDAAPGAVVRYTLDGSEPDGSDPVYSGPLELTGSSRVRARAFRPGWRPSPLVAGDYWRRSRAAVLSADPSGIQLQFSAEAGRAYVVETSTNLFDWTPLVTNLPLTEVMHLSVTNLSDASQRFFRSRLVE